MNSPENYSTEDKSALPEIVLPSGGGSISGMGEKFEVNAVTGTNSVVIPIPSTPGRSGFGPELSLSYDSGAGNGPFGIGWSLSAATITRKTSTGIPTYDDETDTFLLSGTEDLVPYLNGDGDPQIDTEGDFSIHRYLPRTEGIHAKIEFWKNPINRESYWKVTSGDGVISYYGQTSDSRISDPDADQNIFQWLLDRMEDNKGNIMLYEYKAEDDSYILNDSFEIPRLNKGTFANKYLKRIKYSNKTAGDDTEFHQQVVFDYGEHTDLTTLDETAAWDIRQDPFSSFRSAFDIRTYRLCQRVLIFHDFDTLQCVKSTTFRYNPSDKITTLEGITHTGHDGDETKSLPELLLTYQQAEISTEIQSISEVELENIPSGVDGSTYRWMDLEGEGIPGVLYTDGANWYYKNNRGEGTFNPTRTISPSPSLVTESPNFVDLNGDGTHELVIDSEIKGFFEQEEEWRTFKTFSTYPNVDLKDANTRLIDLTGDGFADVLISEENAFTWYESIGKEGYLAAKQVRKQLEENGPAIIFSNPEQSIYLADMTGDGMNDIVRIQNGQIDYWPNLGYGRFGTKISMKNAPRFDDNHAFKQSGILLSDIDGTGTTDILYNGAGAIYYWENYSGNAWGGPIKIDPFPETNNEIKVSVTDILGKGTSCLVWSSALPNDSTNSIQFVDLAASGKPFLMKSMDNQMGLVRQFEYATSTQFYLDDLKNGTPWITKLHFPVHVLKMVTTIDHISSSRLSQSYKYHHGYYDGEEREFRGFGMVEMTDAESFDTFKGESELDIAPVLTKTWYHTGAYVKEGIISTQFATEYYSDDSMTHELVDSTIENAEMMSYQELREAHRAMKGSVLRSEVYSLDDSGQSEIPYTVTETNYHVMQIQELGENQFGVYQTIGIESLSYASERQTNDPRISHSIVLESDEFGKARQSIEIAYPRRSDISEAQTEQLELYALLSTAEYDHTTTDYYRLSVPTESKKYHITGLSLAADAIFLKEDLIDQLEGCLEESVVLKHHESASSGVEARLIEWSTNDYYGGAIEALKLPKSSQNIIASTDHMTNVFGSKVNDTILEEGGYHKDSDHWWVKGETIEYLDDTGFYLPEKVTDTFGNTSEVTYDGYHFGTISAKNEKGYEIESVYNYRTLDIEKLTDENGNISEALYDPLGMVIASTLYGTVDGNLQGDDAITDYEIKEVPGSAAVISDPATYLQGATTFFYYSMESWATDSTPPHYIQLSRATHVSDLDTDEETQILIKIGYSDALGRELQNKVYMGEDEWIVTGRVVHNNKEKPIKQYEPFVVDTYEFQSEEEVEAVGVSPTMHYDPLSRLIRTELPDGFHTKVEFDGWKIVKYDANDTVLDSQNYEDYKHLIGTSAPLGVALDEARNHNDTPATVYLDSLGREFATHDVKTSGGATLVTHQELNIQGLPTAITDPRLYQDNLDHGTSNKNYEYDYDLAENVLKTISADAGTSYTLKNAAGNVYRSWSPNGYATSIEYDELHNPVQTWVEGNGLNHLVQKVEYGTDTAKNQLGKMIHSWDQASKTSIDTYDFKGNAVITEVQLVEDYKNAINWDAAVTLESDVYTIENHLNALGQLKKSIQPDGSVHCPEFYHIGWLKSHKVSLREETFGNESTLDAESFIESIEYNARGQRTKITYSNKVQTEYEYSDLNFRLSSLVTTRTSDSKILQDISYIYDPTGNIVQISDNSHDKVFNAGMVIGPEMEFVYDALYQLTQATGREHNALTKTDYKTPETFKGVQQADINNGADLSTYKRNYTYDDSGNLTKMVHVGNNSYTRNMTIDATSNRAITDEMPGGATIANSFDDAGNMIQLDHLREITWNFMNHISSAVTIQRVTADDAEYYVYDASGNRVRKVHETYDGSGNALYTTEKIYIGVVELKRKYYGKSKSEREIRSTCHVMDGERKIATVYYWDLSDDSHFSEGENRIHYQLENHLGSACLELDIDGLIISYEEYYPFGGTSFTTGNSSKEIKLREYRYSGKERDDVTGLYYYGVRYYAPWMYRWLNPDPAGTVDGFNLYRFVRNNPIKFNDPNGQTPPDPHVQGEIGELLLTAHLDQRGYVYYVDSSKLVTHSGMDLPAFSPNTDELLIFDNKAYSGRVSSVSAFEQPRLVRNLDEVWWLLEAAAEGGDQHAARAVELLDQDRFSLVVSNFNSTGDMRFSPKLFDQHFGYEVLDARTGRYYSNYEQWADEVVPIIQDLEQSGNGSRRIYEILDQINARGLIAGGTSLAMVIKPAAAMAGPVGDGVEIIMIGGTIATAEPDEQGRVAAVEITGFAGGVGGAALGAAGGTAAVGGLVAIGVLSGPGGWAAIVIVGGAAVVGSIAGTETGKAAGGAAYDGLEYLYDNTIGVLAEEIGELEAAMKRGWVPFSGF